jgi:hypothetical protein
MAYSHISRQAFVSAVNDDFLVAAGITIVCLFAILFLKSRKSATKKRGISLE